MGRTEIEAPVGVPQVRVWRVFAAPAELLLKAHLDPELLVQWLGPREHTMVVERYEAHHAGQWRYVHITPDGHEHWFHGVFHGDPSLAGIVQTFEYEGAPGHVKLDTTTFEAHDSGTLVRTVSSFQAVADRDQMVDAGMARGVTDSGERLEELLALIER